MAQQQQPTLDPELKRIYEAVQGGLAKMRELQMQKTKGIEALNKLMSQKNENELVKTELTHLEPGAAVYKLIGPALVGQDVEDAKHVITRRLEHITSEVKRTEQSIKDTEKAEDAQREHIIGLQKQMQARSAQLEQSQQQKSEDKQ